MDFQRDMTLSRDSQSPQPLQALLQVLLVLEETSLQSLVMDLESILRVLNLGMLNPATPSAILWKSLSMVYSHATVFSKRSYLQTLSSSLLME